MTLQPLAALRRRSCALLLLAALLTLVLAPAVAETPPGKGQFLVASRDMDDPNFSKSVILLLSYDADGAMGLIINRPTTLLPEQVIRNVDGLSNYGGPLFVGGPVQLSVVTFLVRDEDTLERGAYVRDDLQYSGNSELLGQLTAMATDAGRLRVYAGYSGWAPGQLDGEIARGGWHVVPGDTDLVFSASPEDVWETLVPRQAPLSAGLRPGHFAIGDDHRQDDGAGKAFATLSRAALGCAHYKRQPAAAVDRRHEVSESAMRPHRQQRTLARDGWLTRAAGAGGEAW